MYSVLLGIQYIGILILVLEILCVLCRKTSKLQNIMLLVLVATLINFVGYLFEMQATTQTMALQAVKFIYLGKPFVILFILIFFIERMNIKPPKFLYPLLGAIHIIVTAMVLTCDSNTLYYSSIHYTEEGLFPHLVLGHSIFYLAYHVLVICYFIFMLVTGIRHIRHTKGRSERVQILYLNMIAVVSVLGLLIFFSGVSRGYDTTIPAYLIATLLLLILITKYDLLDALSLVKEYVMDEFTEGLLVVDGDEKILYANPKVRMVFPELKEGEATQVSGRLHQLCEQGENLYSGTQIYEIYQKEIIKNNTIYGSMFVMRNVTESHNHAIELEKQTQIARSANRAKSDFLAKMSHEIRTPINAVLGMNEMILRESREESVRNYAMDVQNSANALLGIINDILDTSKIESGKMEILPVQYELDSMLNDVVNMVYVKARQKDLSLEIFVDDKLPYGLVGDDVRIRQILVNLLNNSVKYTQEGKVTIQVTGEVHEDEILMHYEIRDTGIGMKEEDLPKLFAAFERIEESKNRSIEGTGLGMSIVFELLKLMDTELQVSSVYGEGSVFSFDLKQGIWQNEPIGDFAERSKELHKAHEYQATFIAPQANILLVDDNDINRKVFCNLLKETGVLIDDVNSGFACLEHVQQKHYDIIFMDHMMPEMDGVETLHRMQDLDHKCKDTPVIILTANAVAGAKERYLAEGFVDYLSKPINSQKLENMLQHYLPDGLVQSVADARAGQKEPVTLPQDKMAYRTSHCKILVVDDNPINLQRAQNILQKYSQVFVVDNGEEALSMMRTMEPDLVLLDINMPGMSGFKVIEQMKSSVELQNIPVIFLTAERSGAVESQCFDAGAEDYVTKPFNSEVLVSRVEKVLALKQYQISLEDMVEAQSEELVRRMTEINCMQREVINSMASLIESRDDSTGNHVRRTSEYVRRIVEILKNSHVYSDSLTEQFISYLLDAAPMHDIGKIKIPDGILQKPGRLTEEEFAVMKTHAAEGGKIIREVLADIETEEYITIAYDVATFHHEKWNGSGYPEGRAGDEIPLSARIMALADVYDALVSERCYKKAMSGEQAYEIIRESSGTHFDPEIAQAVMDNWTYFVTGESLAVQEESLAENSLEENSQEKNFQEKNATEKQNAGGEILQELPQLDEFDWEYAEKYFPDHEMLLQTIHDIYRMIDSDVEKLQNWYEIFTASRQQEQAHAAIEQYRILVHAIKSNMAAIGALLLSKLARILEVAALAKDIPRISHIHPIFVEEMQAHKLRMGTLFQTEEKQELDVSAVGATLIALRQSLEEFDYDEADACVETLMSYSYDKETEHQMDILSRQILELQAEEAKNTIEQLLTHFSQP